MPRLQAEREREKTLSGNHDTPNKSTDKGHVVKNDFKRSQVCIRLSVPLELCDQNTELRIRRA